MKKSSQKTQYRFEALEYVHFSWSVIIRQPIMLRQMLPGSDIQEMMQEGPLYAIENHRFIKISFQSTPFQWPVWEDIFGNKLPVYIEYCSGNGHWIIEQAKKQPLINWVAVEWKCERALRVVSKRRQEQLTNVFVVCADALSFTQKHVATESVAQVFVHFPDPWPKRKHAKHRLLQSPFLEHVARILVPEGVFTVVTDHQPMITQVVEALNTSTKWSSCYSEPYYIRTSSYGNSTFAQLWESKGRSLYITQYTRQVERPRILPFGGNIRSVVLDCGPHSNLKWSIEPGLPALWELETGPLEEEGMIRAFELALDHVIDTVVARHPTFGVLLYKGKAPPPIEVLRSLAARLPDEVTPYIALDLSEHDHSDFFHALQREELIHFGLIIKGGRWPYAIKAIGWDQPSPYGIYGQGELLPLKPISFALCYSKDAAFKMPNEVCRVIPESLLTDEWEGIDTILPIAPTAMGKRKLSGFQASGGVVL